MVFFLQTTSELARVANTKECCQLAELMAFIAAGADMVPTTGEGEPILKLSIRDAAIARRVFATIKKVLGASSEVIVQRWPRPKRDTIYTLRITLNSAARGAAVESGLITRDGRRVDGVPSPILGSDCCSRAYLRALFLMCGYISDPEKAYALELTVDTPGLAEDTRRLLSSFSIDAGVTRHKGKYVVYSRDGEAVAQALRVMGANMALLHLENLRIVKGLRNRVNRIVNFETANLARTAKTAMKQVRAIDLIDRTIGILNLPQALRDIADVRRSNPDLTLEELGRLLKPPASKSAVNHRMRRIMKLAQRVGEARVVAVSPVRGRGKGNSGPR